MFNTNLIIRFFWYFTKLLLYINVQVTSIIYFIDLNFTSCHSSCIYTCVYNLCIIWLYIIYIYIICVIIMFILFWSLLSHISPLLVSYINVNMKCKVYIIYFGNVSQCLLHIVLTYIYNYFDSDVCLVYLLLCWQNLIINPISLNTWNYIIQTLKS